MKKNIFLLLILIIFIVIGSVQIKNNSELLFNTKENNSFDFSNLFKPIQTQSINELSANIVSSVLLSDNNKTILYQENINEKTAIASLTKLMTAVIVMDKYPLDSQIEITEEMLEAWGTSGGLIKGEHVTIQNLIYIMLIESSNDAAECLASKIERDSFIYLMNEKAKELKMRGTSFVNPSGLDEDNGTYNISTAKDLTILVSYIIENYPIIADALSKKTYSILSEEGNVHYLTNTNELLKELPYETWGKTGYTDIANGCLILMTKNEKNDTIVNIVINSNDRFTEMKELINSINNSFYF
jgi:D-alanyl-D-alanine carboxypeptidase